MALIEELVERDGLYIALANRSETELCQLLEFLIWKISDYRYSNVLVEVARLVLNIYVAVIGLSDKVDYRLFKDLEKEVRSQIELQKGLLELSGHIDMIARIATLK